MATIILNVTGMKCGGCEQLITEALQAIAGVSAVRASHQAGTVEVEYDEARTDRATLQKAIEGKGFGVA